MLSIAYGYYRNSIMAVSRADSHELEPTAISPPLSSIEELAVMTPGELSAQIGRMVLKNGLGVYKTIDIKINEQNVQFFSSHPDENGVRQMDYHHSALIVGWLEFIRDWQNAGDPYGPRRKRTYAFYDFAGTFYNDVHLVDVDPITLAQREERDFSHQRHEALFEHTDGSRPSSVFSVSVAEIFAFTLAYDKSKDLNLHPQLSGYGKNATPLRLAA